MPRLSENERNRPLGVFMAGWTKQSIAATFGCSVSTVTRLEQSVHQTGSVKDPPRPGQPRPLITTQRQIQQMMVNHIRDRIDSDVSGNVKTDNRTSRLDPYMYGEELHDTTGRVLLSSTTTWTPMCMWIKCWQILWFLSYRKRIHVGQCPKRKRYSATGLC